MSHRCRLSFVAVTSLSAILACGGGAPPPAPVTPSKPIAVAPEPPPDTTAVPEPAGLVVVGRISKPDGILKTVGSWSHLPLPGSADLVRSIADDAVADAVDLAQPVDGAIALGGSKRDPKPLIAVSVAVRSFDDAKAKLASKHKLTGGKNGVFYVEGIGSSSVKKGPRDEDDDDGESCVLAHASSGARLVCGEREAIDALAPYLTRTVTRQQWPSDIHLEMTLDAVREPLTQLRAGLPFLARSMLGSSSPALGQLIEASVTELVDVVGDTKRMTLDAQVADAGLQATMKVDYGKANSVIARLATAHPERAEAPPAAFLHLPADTDVAMYGKGSDPKLFDHARELLGNVALEATEGAGMPEPERKAVRDLVIDRMLTLFTGPLVYGKGYDAAALEKLLAARNAVKPTDLGALDEANRLLAEQMIGWHLVQVQEPINKVGPMLKDWAALWNRPAFAKWAKLQASGKMLAQMRTAPPPAGVALPKDTVHLEIVIPRADLEDGPVAVPTGRGQKPAPPAKARRIPVRPLVLHVLAVPDQGGSWVGFGMDGKLLAQKAAASLSTAPDGATLGKAASAEALRDVKANGAFLATLRGLLVFSALDRGSHTAFGLLGSLPSKGQTPIVLTFTSQGPAAGSAGSAVASFKLPRGAIEDMIKIALTSH
ncbi:hypothetical protein BH11MYX4_BH11MYX4_43260 [soil metagenome]